MFLNRRGDFRRASLRGLVMNAFVRGCCNQRLGHDLRTRRFTAVYVRLMTFAGERMRVTRERPDCDGQSRAPMARSRVLVPQIRIQRLPGPDAYRSGFDYEKNLFERMPVPVFTTATIPNATSRSAPHSTKSRLNSYQLPQPAQGSTSCDGDAQAQSCVRFGKATHFIVG